MEGGTLQARQQSGLAGTRLQLFEIVFSETTWRATAIDLWLARAVDSARRAPSIQQSRECVA
jgi:hypothetical protein